MIEVARSSFYDAASADLPDDTGLVERMHIIQGETPVEISATAKPPDSNNDNDLRC